MPYQIECQMRTTPLDRQLGITHPWSALFQANWFATADEAHRVIQDMLADAAYDDCFRYRVTFFSVGHPDQFDDAEFGGRHE